MLLYRAEGNSAMKISLYRRGIYWQNLDGGYGSAGMRPERRSRGRNGGGGVSRPAPQHSGAMR